MKRNEDEDEFNPGSAGKFAWGEDDKLEVYASEEEYQQAKLAQEIARTDQLLREAGVDPDNPEAVLGNLDEDEE